MPEAARLAIRVAAGVLADGSGRVLIAQRPPDKHAGGAWEFPGGKLQPGETPRDALDRELHEEIGIRVTGATELVEYTHVYPDRDVTLCVFLVSAWQGEPHSLEEQPLRWVAVDDLLAHGLLRADRPIVAALRELSRS